jgi:hypothetical protein
MDNEDDDDISGRLHRIRAAQEAQRGAEESSDDDDDSLDDNHEAASSLQRKSQQLQLVQLGFTQDYSQSTDASATAPYCQQPSQPSPALIDHRSLLEKSSSAVAIVHEQWAQYGQRQKLVNQPLAITGYEYQTDPNCPFAPGGHLAQRPPLPPSRAEAPTPTASRAPSPASSSVSKKRKGRKSDSDKAEEAKLQKIIESVIDGFKPEFRDYIKCEEECDPKNQEDKEFYPVAKWLKIKKPTPRTLDLSTFSSVQIRRLALNSGVKGGGGMTLFQARKQIALAITMGTVYNDATIANPRTSSSERKVNTMMRITNACFNSEMKDRFIDLNDSKKRADYCGLTASIQSGPSYGLPVQQCHHRLCITVMCSVRSIRILMASLQHSCRKD